MRICIDSSVFIRGLLTADPIIANILDAVGDELTLMIPRLVALEVTRNLETLNQVRLFYQIFQNFDQAIIIDEPVPRQLVQTYGKKGLPIKADAFIGAFAEWKQVDVLLSDNRHFLRELDSPGFTVYKPEEFWKIWHP